MTTIPPTLKSVGFLVGVVVIDFLKESGKFGFRICRRWTGRVLESV